MVECHRTADWQLKAGVDQSQLLLASTSSNHVVPAALCAAAVGAFHVRGTGTAAKGLQWWESKCWGRGEGAAARQEGLPHFLWWKRMTSVQCDTCRSGWQNSQPVLSPFSSTQWKTSSFHFPDRCCAEFMLCCWSHSLSPADPGLPQTTQKSHLGHSIKLSSRLNRLHPKF